MKRFALAVAPVLLLSGCFFPAGGPYANLGTCPAASMQGMVGQPASATAGITYGPRRVYHFNDPVTTDYNPERLNVEIGPAGRIARITCG